MCVRCGLDDFAVLEKKEPSSTPFFKQPYLLFSHLRSAAAAAAVDRTTQIFLLQIGSG